MSMPAILTVRSANRCSSKRPVLPLAESEEADSAPLGDGTLPFKENAARLPGLLIIPEIEPERSDRVNEQGEPCVVSE